MNDHDREMFQWVRAFNPYDLYSKNHEPSNVKALKRYYDDLISEYFPKQIAW
jgi:inositol oxygenase